MVETYLGIDIGTSAVKAVLIGADRAILAEAETPLWTSQPRPFWMEQDAIDWWLAVETVTGMIARAAPESWRTVAGIGLSGQMHGAVMLDRDDQPLRPVMLWNDGRAEREAAELQSNHPDLAEVLGVPAMPGFTAPKLLWSARHEPDIFAATDVVLSPKDYVRLRLTGTRASEMSDAAGTWLFDQAARGWSRAAADAIGLPFDKLPLLTEGSDVSGLLRFSVAERWGLRPDVIVAGGAGDCPAGGVGIGAIDEGDTFLSLGTSAQLFRASRQYRPRPERMVHAFCHAVPGRWFQMAAMLNGASAFAWVAGILGRDIHTLSMDVESRYSGPSDLLFLPYLTGERTPYNDPYAKGVFFGLTSHTTSESMAQAVMEGVAFIFADAKDAMAVADTSFDGIGIIGGGSRSVLWARIIAAVLDRPLIRFAGGEKGPAFGAAALARMAKTGEPPEDVAITPPITGVVEPEPRLVDAYRPRVEAFRRLYAALKPEFGRL